MYGREVFIIFTSSACFSGYAPEEFAFPLERPHEEYGALVARINIAVIQSVLNGYLNFYCGMNRGFDIICGETAVRLRRVASECSRLRLIAVLPFRKHGQNWGREWKLRHNRLLEHADEVVFMGEKHHHGCLDARDCYLVDHSSLLICCRSMEDFMVEYARYMELRIINICE